MTAPPTSSRALPATLAWLLALWFACGVSVALAAIAAFPSLSGRGVIVPGFETLADHDPAASGRLAAGFVMERVFAATDLAQWAIAPIATVAASLCWRRLGGRLAAVVAILAAIALGLTLVHNLSIGPTMEASLEDYRTQIRDGDLESALASRDGFDATHVLADRLYGLRMLAIGLALPLSLFLPGLPSERNA